MNKTMFKPVVLLVTVLMVLFSFDALADRDKRDWGKRKDRDERQERQVPERPSSDYRPERSRPDYRFGKRFDDSHRYPRSGVIIRRLPERRYPIRYRDKSYFYFSGTWYLPSGPNYVVVRPPIGIIVPVLPPFYTTIWFGGTPYYYANEVYYVWRPDLNGYQVTEPPLEEPETALPLIADELFAYPKKGQSEEKQAEDRYACHRWGVEQTNYDPIQPPQNLPLNELSRLRADYQRAMKACLEGRGYSVR